MDGAGRREGGVKEKLEYSGWWVERDVGCMLEDGGRWGRKDFGERFNLRVHWLKS